MGVAWTFPIGLSRLELLRWKEATHLKFIHVIMLCFFLQGIRYESRVEENGEEEGSGNAKIKHYLPIT